MVKIFIGNLPTTVDKEEIQALFAEYGTVTECAIVKNFAFVHMDDRKSATKAIKNLHLHKLHGSTINVEASRGKMHGSSVKLHIANVEKGCDDELRALFEEYGTVSECAIIKNFAFVHMDNHDEAMDAMKGLDNHEFQGKRIHVQMSKHVPKYEESEDYGPPHHGREGYWPPRYPGDRHEPPPPGYLRGRLSHHLPPHGYPAPPPPPPPPRRTAYPERAYARESDGYGVVDYYEKYRARPYGISAYADRRASAIPPPPPPSAFARERLVPASLDPYERRALAPPPSSYYARDRSPIRRAPPPPLPPAGNGYSYERSRLSPVSRAPMYAVPRARDPYADRLPLPPPPYAY